MSLPCSLIFALLIAPLAAQPAAAPPAVSWTFDEARDTGAVQPASERLDSLQGAIEFVPGVRGRGLKFDGFTSRLVRAAKDLPQFGPALTVEAWIIRGLGRGLWIRTRTHGRDSFSASIIWAKSASTLRWTANGSDATRRSQWHS